MNQFVQDLKDAVKRGVRPLSAPEIGPEETMPKLEAYALATSALGLSSYIMLHGFILPILIPAPKLLSHNIQLAFNTVAADLEEKAAKVAKAPARLKQYLAFKK